jgi:hypothetical protein
MIYRNIFRQKVFCGSYQPVESVFHARIAARSLMQSRITRGHSRQAMKARREDPLNVTSGRFAHPQLGHGFVWIIG